MSERPLLLSSARSGVLVSHTPSPWWRHAAVALGIIAVVIGAADVCTRLALLVALPQGAAFTAFAPAAALQDPQAGSISNTLTSTTAATSTITFMPTRLTIPSIGVNAAVERVQQKSDGSMGTPSTFYTVGWYSLGPKPGEAGNTVIDGHVNNALGLSGVFEHLGDVNIGDAVQVSGADGQALMYIVTSVQEYPTNGAPLDTIFATQGRSQLMLITCDGEWVSADHSYDKRLVVTARLAL